MAHSARRDINMRVAALIIHGFTVAHVVVAGVLRTCSGCCLDAYDRRDGLEEKGNMSFFDKIQLLIAAVRLQENNREFTQKLKDVRQKMTDDERTKYDNFMKIITNRNSSKDERVNALYGADILLKPYGVSIGFAA